MSLQDGIFAEQVENDITLFSKDARRKRVLVFPPVNNYRRFLIHQLVQDNFGDILKTFSIGQDLARRTVVCYQSDFISDRKLNGVPSRDHVESNNSYRLDSACAAMGGEERRSPPGSPEHLRMRQIKSAPAVEIYRPPAARRAGKNNQTTASAVSNVAEASSSSAKVNRHRRPDRAVYVPKHRRSTDTDDIGQTSETSRKSSSPYNINGNGRSSNKEETTRRSVSSCSADCCDKNNESSEQSAEDTTPVDHQLFVPAVPDRDNRGTMEDSIIRSETESRVSIESATRSLSASSDETIIFATEKHRIRNVDSSISNDCSGDETVTSDALKNNDVEIIPECSSSADSRIKKRERRESPGRDDERVNNKNAETLVSNVLIISDRKDQRLEAKSTNVEKETIAIKSPEKKLKKVARVKSKPASPPAPPVKLNRDECDWDSLFDDNGECLDPTLIEELTAAVGEVTIEPPRNDYKAFSRPVEVSNDEFAHVVEIYNFPSDFKTSDLAVVFSPWKNGGFELKWVDDTHCLGVFSSPLVASEVLASDHPFVKTRPLSAATALSKTKARKSAEFLQPYKSRPETCAALARRLVTGALGVKLATARQEREQEKAVLREAKEKRRLANKQREDVWEGIIAEK